MREPDIAYDHPAACPICAMILENMTPMQHAHIARTHYEGGVCTVCLNDHRDTIPWAELFKGTRR